MAFKVYNSLKLFANQTNFEVNDNLFHWFKRNMLSGTDVTFCNQCRFPEGHVVSGTVMEPSVTNLSESAIISLKLYNKVRLVTICLSKYLYL